MSKHLLGFFLSFSSSFVSSFSILGIVYHFSFSTSLPITLTSPPPTGGTPAVRKGRGTDYHVIHVTGTARDTQRYTVTRDTSNHFLSFTVPPFYLDPLDSRYLLFVEFPLFCYFFPLRSMENERQTRVANFLCSLTSVSLSLTLSASLYFFISSSHPFSCSRGCFRGACFASDYYLLRSESTAGLWYTGSMVSRYTPATAAPSSRPLGEPVRSPAASRRAPPTASPVLRSPAVAVATALSSHHSPIRRTVLCRPSRAASTFCSRDSRDVSTVDLPESLFYRPTRQTSMSHNDSILNEWVDLPLTGT